jgi:putative transposase
VFFEEGDYSYYLHLMRNAARESKTAIWAYCLMPNHVHFIAVPTEPDGLRKLFADAHRRYTSVLNARHDWTGHLWQGRFSSVAMDARHLMAAVRYVTLNPVRAGLAPRAEDWRWSSARAHLDGRSDGVVDPSPVLERTGDFAAYLGQDEDIGAIEALKRSYSTGRPVGADSWLQSLSAQTGRNLAPVRPGPRPRDPVTVY